MSYREPNKSVDFDLLLWIPLDARRVLELGCGDGALAALYKRRNPDVEYVAVEADQAHADAARPCVDRLIEADFTALTAAEVAELGQFDVVVLGDVLVRQQDPRALLGTLASLLKPSGQMVLTTPNAAHWSAIAGLISGTGLAAESGLADFSGMRFFTLNSLREVLARNGFHVERARRLRSPEAGEAKRWLPILANAAEQAGINRTAFLQQAEASRYVATALRTGAPSPPRLHVHFAALAPDFLDVRTRLPMEALASEFGVTTSYQERSSTLPDLPSKLPKIAILQRSLAHDERLWREYINKARRMGWVMVYEIDDHPDLVARVHQTDAQMGAALKISVAYNCHAAQTSTEMLAQALRVSNPEVAAFGNCVFDLPPFAPRPGVRRVFYGALNREAFSSQIAAALEPFLAANPDVHFEVVHDRAFFDALPTAQKTFRPVRPYADYLTVMASCDVVLSPLEGLGGEAYKSDIKFLEASRAGAAMIASPAVYEATIKDGVTGFIAREAGDWATCLSRLIAEPDLRNTIARAAWDYVKAERMMCKQVAARRDWYRSLIDRRAELDAALLARWTAAPLP
jgi:2-polyprenyl-3-methyl-5-hydroxy-6-metoxy-1,4-benzoquinol methylase